ncbi:hypothetical protein EV700_1045 [Fluviicoccus keumensis]|uniref:Uncharacterized protein n=1 Tax=Fluviicoccus keumensis TaxID=1435465 RepID=A0A4Q7ZDD9_9GAMM|nr:hypothetical protein [Fluviicoccus keumensis]RZU48073.1 hypothetical protein EV700_1045 [Fluviicoccus keumensis]
MPHLALVRTPARPPLQPGETPMPQAPAVTLPNGAVVIPQHYLQYRQTADTVRALLADIEFDPNTLLFAGQDANGLYLQAGLVGRENYDRSNTLRPRKLVYGRKWRIDADTPTSEVIQTAFLAISKAREHEVRELLTLTDPDSGKTSAAFSHHHDLPLMAAHPDQVLADHRQPLLSRHDAEAVVSALQFAQRRFTVTGFERRHNGSLLVDLQLGEAPLARRVEGDLAEYDGLALTLMLREGLAVELLYELMEALVRHSHRYVEEHFRFRDFNRFSWRTDPRRIAALSVRTRPYARDAANGRFMPVFRNLNYETDRSRAPTMGSGPLAVKNRAKLARFGKLQGHMPGL